MINCRNCGTVNDGGNRFCAACGAEMVAPVAYRNAAPLYETKIIQVANTPSVINESNEEWARFGWNVQNVQVTHSQDTRTYTQGLDWYTGNKTVETTTINYATITYQRDKNMPNYDVIVGLEREYNQVEARQYCAISEFDYEPVGSGMLLAGIFISPLLIYYAYRKVKGVYMKNKCREYVNGPEYAAMEREKMQIAEEAARYLRY